MNVLLEYFKYLIYYIVIFRVSLILFLGASVMGWLIWNVIPAYCFGSEPGSYFQMKIDTLLTPKRSTVGKYCYGVEPGKYFNKEIEVNV